QRVKAINKQVKLQRQMEHAQRLESLGVLAGGIAHDFNNILTSIMGNAALAEFNLIENIGVVGKYLSNIVTSSERAADLCKQMLDYSGKGQFEVKTVDISKVINETSLLLEVSIDKGIELQYELAK
ncbi:MAG: histidine kinase, partial [Gammaproteobacteria bacterium]